MREQGQADRAAWEGEMFRLLAENVLDYAVFIIDPHRHVLSWSKGAERLLGFTETEIVGQKCDLFFTPEDAAAGVPQKELDEALATGRGDDDRWHVRKDGSRFWSSGAVTPLRDPRGALRGFAKIMRDRTDLKRSQDALEDARAFAEAIVATVREPLVVLDGDLRVQTANRSFYAAFRARPEDTEGRPLYDLGNRQWDIPALRKLLGEVLPQNAAFDGFEVEHDFPDIGRKVMLLNARKLHRDGHTDLILLVIEDVTALRERQRQLEFVTDHAPVLLAHCDTDCRYKFVNKPYAERFGLHPRDVVGRTIPEVLGAEAFARIEPFTREALAGRRVEYEAEVPYDGIGTQTMRVAYEPERDEDGRVTGYVAAIQNVTERKRAEQELAASRQRLQALYDNTLDAILVADDDARYVDANPAACALLGYQREELLRRGVFDVTPVPNAEAGRAAWAAFVREGRQVGEYALTRSDGSVAVVEYRAAAGVLPGLHLSVLRDVTERKRTEEALRASERRFRALATHAPVGIFQTDPDGHCLFVNDRWCRITGLSAAEAAGTGWARALHPDDAERVRAEWYAAAAAGREFDSEYRFRAPDGRTAWVRGQAVALRDESGAVTGHLGTVTDTTEQRRATEALRENERLLRAVLDAIPVGVVVAEAPAGKLVLSNPQAEAIWRHPMPPAERVEEYRRYHGFHPDGRAYEPHEWPLARSLAGAQVLGEEIEFERGDGTRGTMRVSSAPIRGDGRVTAAVVVFADITDRLAAEAALRASEARLAEAQRIARVGSWEVDWRTKEVRWSDEMYRLFGTEPGEFEPTLEGFFAAVPTEEHVAIRQALQRALAGTAAYRVDHRIVRTDGAVRVVSEQAEVEFDPSGEALRIVGTMLDVTERVRAEEARREVEGRLRALSDNLPDGAVYQTLATPDGGRRFAFISAGVERLFGVTAAEATADAMTLYGLVHEADRARVAEAEAVALRDSAPFDCEFRSWTRSGELRWVHCRSAPRRLPDGETIWEGIVLDVTARKKAEEERARLALLVENATDFIGICDPDYRPFFVNRAGLRMVGLASLDEALRTPVPEFFFPEDRAFVADEFLPRVLRDGHAEVEIRFRHFRTGEPIWVVYSVMALKDESGRPTGLATVSRDITARKQAEARLRTQNERLRLLSEAAGHLLAVEEPGAMMRGLFERLKDHLGADAYFNFMVTDAGDALRLESCAGIPDEVARSISRLEFGQAVCGMVARERRPAVATHVQQSDDPRVQLVRGFGVRAYACNPLLVEGRLYGTLSFASRSRDEFTDDELSFLQTVTHYVTMAYERVRLIQGLRDADRRKDEFLATLAHELRNPLAPIRNSLEVIKVAGANAAAAERARGVMERQLGQMVHLIDDLLDVSRITRGKLQLRRERVELAGVVQSAVEASRPLVEASAHRLTVELPDGPVHLDADPTRLAQVFSNLLTNAAKYTERGGDIRLTAARDGGGVVVSVRDTGIGIAAEHLPRLFEMFSQVSSALDRAQGGLGIGLALVKALVEMHGGTVEGRSEGPGKGSEFVVRLPTAAGTARPPAPAAVEPSTARAHRVLVADDNRDSAESLAEVLQLGGHEVHTAHDGPGAVDAAERVRPDVAVLDIGMPGLTGYEVARRIRARPWGRAVVLVALTGWGQEDDKRRAADAGFDHHLTKPVDPAALAALLAALPPRAT